ncbi:DNA (cytosine-5-)-methyltransferase [Acidimicrobiia bacterium]|nr:DNA (cytosine-5-)-methyltransferase [Acidimicrobiia bacterium]
MTDIKVVELFAGVGGFRLGLESIPKFKVVWSNQWEPQTKVQYASSIYEEKFGPIGHSNVDIEDVPTNDIPDHNLLCGGFPCQDYSVASTLKNSKGLIGKKGVLWWSIHRILNEKSKKPELLLLENVDRLLVSPSTQKGRDFAVMLKSLDELGYAVEWRVVNAGEYGFPQRRRRVFFIGYLKGSKLYKDLIKNNPHEWILENGVFASSFNNSYAGEEKVFNLDEDIVSVSEKFNTNGGKSPFLNSGLMVNSEVLSLKVDSNYSGKKILLKEILEKGKVADNFYIDAKDLPKWEYLKGAKKEERISSSGFKYNYAEGAMIFPDNLENASRTIITSEGGASPSRFRHVVKTNQGLRRLTPLELERLNMFPDNFTKFEGISDSKRAFLMGNALVVGVVRKIADEIARRL